MNTIKTSTVKVKRATKFSTKYYPELNGQEKIHLFNHYQKREANQFFLIIIMKVLEKKTFTCNTHDVIIGSLIKYSHYDFDAVELTCIDEVLDLVYLVYRRLMIIDIIEIDTSGF